VNCLFNVDPYHFNNLSGWIQTGWTNFIKKEIEKWKNTTLQWLPKIGRGGILVYEDMLKDKENQFRILMRLIGLEVDERRLECVIKHDFSHFKRNSTSTGNTKNRLDIDVKCLKF
jgi:hypothetical protein